MDDYSFFLGWISATSGYLLGWLGGELSSFIRWRKRVAEIKLQTEAVISFAVKTGRGELHFDPPKP